jgi:uncharacterized protein (DUF3820 family)
MTMPFGKFKGEALEALPTDYLDWLCRTAIKSDHLLKAIESERERRRLAGEVGR